MVEQMGSRNEAKKIEEVTRIVFFEVDTPYDILGVNWKASFDDIKKRYLKLSLMVHPDKCSHPQAHQAFMILNQAYKDLQNPEKRKAFDKKFRLKEVQEAFIICALKKGAELKAMREAAWRRHLRGISPLVGDAELLGFPKEKLEEGSGDTSAPFDKSISANQNREAADADCRRKSRRSDDADLMDKYELAKRSKSLLAQKHARRHIYRKPAKRSTLSVQKHREERERPERRTKEAAKREGMHPWSSSDRDEDLASGRQKNTDLDSGGLARFLAYRFSSSCQSAQRKV